MNKFKLPAVARKLGVMFASALMASVTLSSATAYAAIAQKPLFLTGEGLPPNVLLIPDTSESMQEGLIDGRVALDFSSCTPGQITNPSVCVAGAANTQSKASIVKRTGLALIDDYMDQINLGLLSYQQSPASRSRDDFNSGGTVRWRLVERLLDVRYSNNANPSWYQPATEQAWNSDIKTNRIPSPRGGNRWVFFNTSVVGYDWNTSDGTFGLPTSDRVLFTEETNTRDTANVPPEWFRHTWSQMTGSGGLTNLGTVDIYMTDILRQRGISSWGRSVLFLPLNQVEWRSTSAPGLGYLHVPIGGRNADGTLDSNHWDRLRTKLQPQRVDWNGSGNPMTDSSWPLVAAGLTPLEGTMLTARDYFMGERTYFNNAQGRANRAPIPQSCDANAAIWITDGLPSVSSDGTPLGQNPVLAVRQAADAVATFHGDTDIPLYVIGFAMPPGVGGLFAGQTDFPTGNPLDLLAEKGGTGSAYDASSEAELKNIMDEIFSQIVQEARGSAASAAASSTSLQTDTAIFVAGFDSRDWTGELKAFRVNRRESDEDSLLDESPAWNAEDKLPAPGSRNILTWVPDSSATGSVDWAKGDTKPFTTSGSGLSAAQISVLSAGGVDVDDLVGWLRGDQSNEGAEPGDLRRRTRVLGDIVNSSPLYIRNQNFNYQLFPETEGGTKYNAFLDANRTKAPLIAVASNNGMLHVFDARLPCRSGETAASDGCSADGGKEVFSYVPNALMSRLPNLAKQNYDREYYFDGSPRIGHVYDGTDWRRILVASLGAGGKAVVAIDIDSQEVLWELDASHNDNLGYVLGDPILGKAASGEWITVIPNGYDSVNNRASLIILNTLTGEEITTWTPTGSNPSGNAMFEPLPLDVTGDRRIDRIYAGDLEGNLWRYDLDPRGPGQWGVINSLRSGGNDGPLFKAVSPEGQKQPITVRPNAARDSSGIIHLVFGTGKYFEVGDNAVANVPTQSLYGIRDEDDTVARSDLLEQSIIYEGTEHGFDVRVSTDLVVGSNRKGWRLDLIYDGQNNGERLVQNPIIRGSRAVFATLIPEPNPDPCEPGDGTGWIMEIDAFNGARLSQSPWDLSGDGFGEESFVNVPGLGLVPASGIRSPVGIPTIPAVVEDHQLSDREYKFVVGSTGDVWELPDESRDGAGRQFWRQLR
ncbi:MULTISPECIES: pilus assembly protein [unclassified Marinobacter]|uniref:pilus assembly protein n=1 Tax=unclassified Marinobacter TaxID=83889 RepID=UPI0012A7A88E|nr:MULTISPECIES: PilC/PilY family type IV pilus protein [unclassified Marinobacter]QFS85895.1 Neisseria PilC protein [Marinobacter sp. THAF197a]QFT49689.1 Neisseria PilC protein [Marinobacter sp. THAF39]